MSFSSEQFVAKLNRLEDSQESIASASKWLLSQHRDAPKIAESWKQYMLRKDVNTRRKLLAIYVVNHVVQQAAAQNIGHFQEDFNTVIEEVLITTFAEFSSDLKKKIARVVGIWKSRGIFSRETLNRILANFEKNQKINNSVNVNVPPKLKPVADIMKRIEKIQINAHAMKTRFDNAISELDPSSLVYDENYKTVQKVGGLAKNNIASSVQERKKLINALQSLIEEQNKLVTEGETMQSEIDFTISSKDPANATGTGKDDEDVLPTYEATDDTNGDSESDSDNSIDDDDKVKPESIGQGLSSDTLDVLAKMKALAESNNNNNLKRSNDELDNDEENDLKRQKEDNDETGMTYDQSNEDEVEGETEHVSTENSDTVTSSIQDLLSKLAN
ncbi:hypothetical protein C6P45_000880 [Maudiozyma exigua]|uniref:CID domain-containing protein n=1 Tax=Maudiozyma exigua TaxID=34358 RepID=A0A9P6W373_MAUEX|nr:hypothetical protein C6P45_000880 [Kazachstania exigua]